MQSLRAGTIGGVSALVDPTSLVAVDSITDAIESFSAASEAPARAEIISAVDLHGHRWECRVARRAVQLEGEFGRGVERLATIHDELVVLRAQSEWLRRFPAAARWRPRAFVCEQLNGESIPRVLRALHDVNLVAERLRGIDLQLPAEKPYVPLRISNANRSPAVVALAEAGSTLTDVARALEVDQSAVSLWLSGARRPPDDLAVALEALIGEADAERVASLIPYRPEHERGSARRSS